MCANQQLFINLGAYDYDTPSGCADETVSSLFLFFFISSLGVGRFWFGGKGLEKRVLADLVFADSLL